jgi:hypothetical protein
MESALDSFGSSDLARHPNRKKDRAEAAFLHPWDVDAAPGIAASEIEIAIEKALCGVVVRIHDDRGKVELAGAGRDIVTAHAWLQKCGHE